MRYLSERKYNRYLKIGLLLFVLFTWQVVPLIHELGHVIALEIYNCKYWARWEHGYFKELYGKIYDRCDLNPNQLLWLYASGLILTTFIGILFLSLEIISIKKKKIEWALIFLFTSYAFLLDLVNYLLFPQGDVEAILSLTGKENAINKTPFLGIFLLMAMITYLYISIHEELEVIIIKEEGLIKKWMKKLMRYLKRKHVHH